MRPSNEKISWSRNNLGKLLKINKINKLLKVSRKSVSSAHTHKNSSITAIHWAN